jgi:Transcriptional regulators
VDSKQVNDLSAGTCTGTGHASDDAASADIDAVLVYNILRTNASLGPDVDRGLRDLHLTGAQFNALLVLRDAGPEGLPLSEIGRLLVVTKANVTGLIDRLERHGLVRRDGGALPDRRITRACLTEEGAALLETALPHHRKLLSQLLSGLTPPEKMQLITLLTRLRRGLREARAGDSEKGGCG